MKFLLITCLSFFSYHLFAQGCCSGGSGSPIAGGTSQGVLQERQFEIAGNLQSIQTNKFKAGSADTLAPIFKSFSSNYLYMRAAYGITKSLTMSVESGYFLKKQQFNLNDSAYSKGIADLIIFPRYDVYNRSDENKRVELTLGVGLKIPLGKYNDSMIVYRDPVSNVNYYTTSPPTVQPTTGSHDFIFYAFFFRGFPIDKFRVFANSIYIKKGWNPLGEKFGDYKSISVFAGKNIFKNLGLTLQLKSEWISEMKAAKNTDLLAFYGVDIQSTGSKKLFVIPQLNFSHRSLNFYILSEFPLWQYVNKSQIASQHEVIVGISYRFFTIKSIVDKK